MTLPVPQTVAESLWSRITALLEEAVHTDRVNSFLFNGLLRDCDRLSKTDVIHASLYRGALYSVVGKDEDAEYQFDNVEANGEHFLASAWRMAFFSNRGYAKRVMAMADQVLNQRGSISFAELMRPVASMGGFQAICRAVDAATQRQEVLVGMTNLLEKSRRACAVMNTLKITDEDVSAAVDVAGEIIREQRLVWKHQTPDIEAFDEDCDFRSLMLQFRLGVTPQKASELTFELIGRLVDRDLDRAGLSVCFLGEELESVEK